jgi:sec-independent protein translocase protein TatA
MAGLTGWHLLILVVVLVLLFGAKRLPDMARAVGQSARIFKGEIKSTDSDEHTPTRQQPPPPHS